MPTLTVTWRTLRRRLLTPSTEETKFSTRGFREKDPETLRMLEHIGEVFLSGYAIAAEARSVTEAEAELEKVAREFRGFAYEGAGMGFAVREGLPAGRRWLDQFLAGRGDEHVYMIYVGAGWAMARLPKSRWAKLTAGLRDPVLCWLALDGYGFHQAYFHTARYVRGHYREPVFPWPAKDPTGYASRVIDQGIGRATWFVCGADADLVADALDAFPADRQADLYSGAALAATYAGGAGEAELQGFLLRGAAYQPEIAQGSAFACAARVRAGLVTSDTELAAAVLCGTTPKHAESVCRKTLPDPSEDGEVPAFELWRGRIASTLTAVRSDGG